MRFPMPHFPSEFEIPDDWLSEAGLAGFEPYDSAYRSTTAVSFVPLTQVEPPVRFATHPLDSKGFVRARLVRLLKGFVAGDDIEPVEAMRLPVFEICGVPYRYRVCHGYHRFYASIAVGFDMLPIT
jgi:hypothetical protein